MMKEFEAVEKACQQPTLVDALSWIAIWETERVVRQAHLFFTTGERTPDGAGWETCFKHLFSRVMERWTVLHGVELPSSAGEVRQDIPDETMDRYGF